MQSCVATDDDADDDADDFHEGDDEDDMPVTIRKIWCVYEAN